MSALEVANAIGDDATERSVFFTLQSIRAREPQVLGKPARGLWKLNEASS
jgi:hypothetical protein